MIHPLFRFPILATLSVGLFFACGQPSEDSEPEPGPTPTPPTDTSYVRPAIVADTIQGIVVDSTAIRINFSTEAAPETTLPEAGQATATLDGHNVYLKLQTPNQVVLVKGQDAAASLTVESSADLILVLDSLDLTAVGQAPIRLYTTGACRVVIPDPSFCRLNDQSTDADSTKAALYSRGQLLLSGCGQLEISSKQHHGISAKGGLSVVDTHINLQTAKDGLHSDTHIQLLRCLLEGDSQDDFVQSESGRILGQGLDLSTSVSARKGTALTAGGCISLDSCRLAIELPGEAAKGIKSDSSIYLTDNTILIVSTGQAIYDESTQDVSSAAGIKCNGDLVLDGDSHYLSVEASGDGGKGLNVNGDIWLKAGTTRLATKGKTFTYGNLGTAAKAIKGSGRLIQEGGLLEASAQNDALACDGDVFLNGSCHLWALDDAVKTLGSLSVNGDTVMAYSEQNDAFDAQTGIYLQGGYIVAVGADADKKGAFETEGSLRITGGEIIAVGNKNAKPSLLNSTQCCLCFSRKQAFAEGTVIRLESADGRELMDYALPRAYSERLQLTYSAPDLQKGQSYSLYSGQSLLAAFSQSSMVTELK